MWEIGHNNVADAIGIVAIGRNEGARLRRALDSAVARVKHVVYVDSGSDDGSPAMARLMGVDIVELDLSTPFTAARARNAGLDRLMTIAPHLSFVQFIDGDCELVDGWLEAAVAAMNISLDPPCSHSPFEGGRGMSSASRSGTYPRPESRQNIPLDPPSKGELEGKPPSKGELGEEPSKAELAGPSTSSTSSTSSTPEGEPPSKGELGGSIAVVCGRCRERFPEKSRYNRLCDIEWDTPIGEALFCGGNAMMRCAALRQAGGFNGALIAGEEPELSLRLRQAGWHIRRIDAEMVLHDADMTQFRQWWRRQVRNGHAYAENERLHRPDPTRFGARETRSNWFWGMALPLTALVAAPCTGGLSLALLLGYPVLSWRVYSYARTRGQSPSHAALYALFCAIGKFPQVFGQLQYVWKRLRGKRSKLIEYK